MEKFRERGNYSNCSGRGIETGKHGESDMRCIKQADRSRKTAT
jgi:hypothetical protein